MPNTQSPAPWGLYTRISKDLADTGLGVARQEKANRELATQLGIKVVSVYSDNDLSASSGKPRPEYERMLSDVAAGTIKGVIAWSLDRLTRRPAELERFFEVIDAAGAKVATIEDRIDPVTGDGMMVARIKGAVAAEEVRKLRMRLKSKHDELAAAGKFSGGKKVYGYDFGGAAGLIVAPAEAAIVRECADRVLDGESLYSVVHDLNDRGVPTTTDRPWTSQTLIGILTSDRIAGRRVHNDEVTPAAWDPIIDAETSTRLRAVLRANKGRRSVGRRYLLTGGLARCGRCGSWLHAQPRHAKNGQPGKPGYNCRTEKGGCGRLTIDAERLEETVVEMMLAQTDHSTLRIPTAAPDETGEDEELLISLAADYGNKLMSRAEYMTAKQQVEQRLQTARLSSAKAVLRPYIEQGLRAAWEDDEIPFATRRTIISAFFNYVEVMPATRRGPVFDKARVIPDPADQSAN